MTALDGLKEARRLVGPHAGEPIRTAEDVLAVLERCHSKDVVVREVRLSSGASNLMGRIDLWCIDPSIAAGCRAIAYEVKVTRSDFKRDTYEKQRGARLFSDQFYYATPPGLLRPEEIPDWAGLVEVYPGEPIPEDHRRFYGKRTHYAPTRKYVVQAPKLDKAAPSWGLVVSLLRRCPPEALAEADAGQEGGA